MIARVSTSVAGSWIDGAPVVTGGGLYQVINPATGEAVADYALAAPADVDRGKNARQRIGGPQCVNQAAARQPDLMTGADLGGDGRKAQRQVVDGEISQRPVEALRQPAAPDEPRAGQIDIEIAQDIAGGEAATPLLEPVEVAGRITAACDRADRGPGNHVWRQPFADQRADHPDVSEPTRRPAAERQADRRPPRRRGIPVRGRGPVPVLSACQKIQQDNRPFSSAGIMKPARFDDKRDGLSW